MQGLVLPSRLKEMNEEDACSHSQSTMLCDGWPGLWLASRDGNEDKELQELEEKEGGRQQIAISVEWSMRIHRPRMHRSRRFQQSCNPKEVLKCGCLKLVSMLQILRDNKRCYIPWTTGSISIYTRFPPQARENFNPINPETSPDIEPK